jgi:hypothetical protein
VAGSEIEHLVEEILRVVRERDVARARGDARLVGLVEKLVVDAVLVVVRRQRELEGRLRAALLEGLVVRLEGSEERLDAREQALLEVDENERALPSLRFIRLVYSASFCASIRSGEEGSPTAVRTRTRFGNGSPPSWRRSSFRRRTMTASSCARPRTGTPRMKRCGSISSRSAEKLFEWPLCGVALKKRRFSNLGAMSRTTSVILESIAYLLAPAGAATCASSRMRRLFAARSPMC